MNGVSNYFWSYQFISLDGTRSAFASSGLEGPNWTDHFVPQSKQIRKVETLLTKFDGLLNGFKWFGDDGAVLVAVGLIEDDDFKDDEFRVVTSLTLNPNQRLVGVKSASNGLARAEHSKFQWVICTEE